MDEFHELIQELVRLGDVIQEAKETAATNLTSKLIIANANETLRELVDKIGEIEISDDILGAEILSIERLEEVISQLNVLHVMVKGRHGGRMVFIEETESMSSEDRLLRIVDSLIVLTESIGR